MAVMQGRLAELEAQNVEPSAGHADSDIEVSLKPGIQVRSKDGAFAMGVDGLIQGDAAWFDDDAAERPDGANLRRVRLGVKGTVDYDWGYRFQAEFGNGDETLLDASLSYNGFEDTTLTVGQFKEPFSLEQLSAANNFTFLEKASPAALSPARAIGAAVSYAGESYTLTGGVFGAEAATRSTDDEAWSVTGRGTWTPVQDDNKLLHLGVAGSYRMPDQNTDTLQFRSFPENSVDTLRAVDTGAMSDVKHSTVLGAETAGYWGPVFVQGEYIHADISRENGMSGVDFDGAYVQGSWFLTGEHRAYNARKGIFDAVKPNDPFSRGRGAGAWEVAARYSTLDLTDGGITGGRWIIIRPDSVGIRMNMCASCSIISRLIWTKMRSRLMMIRISSRAGRR